MPKPLLIVKWGESNSAGRALNTSATAAERLSQPRLKYLNNTSLLFENLLIGTNNIIDHQGATDGGGITENPIWSAGRHGWEVPLSTAIRDNAFGQRQVYMVHTGQGGSQSSGWTEGGVFMVKATNRINAARAILNNDYDVVVWGTIGINNAINQGLSQRSVYVSEMLTTLTVLRSKFVGKKVPILLTGLTAGWPEYTEEVKRVCQQSANTRFIASLGASESSADGGDSNHWGYSGVKTIGIRLIKATLAISVPQL